MQYLLKISIESTNCWRLIAVDGQADLAHVAELIALAFDYEASKQSFIVKDKIITCGKGGEPLETRELNAFDSLNLSLNEEFYFQHESNKLLKHKVLVMKKEDHLYCLMPSCLVGSLVVPKEPNLTAQTINQYADSDEIISLDLRAVTNRLRAYGSLRKDLNQAMINAGAEPIVFKGK